MYLEVVFGEDVETGKRKDRSKGSFELEASRIAQRVGLDPRGGRRAALPPDMGVVREPPPQPPSPDGNEVPLETWNPREPVPRWAPGT